MTKTKTHVEPDIVASRRRGLARAHCGDVINGEMRRFTLACVLVSALGCGSKSASPASEPTTREVPVEREPERPLDPLAGAPPIRDQNPPSETRILLADAALAFSLDPDRVRDKLDTMRESAELRGLVAREMGHAKPVLRLLEEERAPGTRIDGAMWSPSREQLTQALRIIEQEEGVWAIARAMPGPIATHVRLEVHVQDPARAIERLESARWGERKRKLPIPGYDWDDPDACAGLSLEPSGAVCRDAGNQVLVAKATEGRIRVDAVNFWWPWQPLRTAAAEDIAGVWPSEGADLAARIEEHLPELMADVAGIDPMAQKRVVAVKEALARIEADNALETGHDMVMELDTSAIAAYSESSLLASSFHSNLGEQISREAHRLVTGEEADWEPINLKPLLGWEGVLPPEPAFEGVRIGWDWTDDGRSVVLRWRRHPTAAPEPVPDDKPEPRRAELCHGATACMGFGHRAAALLDLPPLDRATIVKAPFRAYGLDSTLIVISGVWPHVVAGAVADSLPTGAPKNTAGVAALWARLGRASPPDWALSVAAPDITEDRALAAWRSREPYGRGPEVELAGFRGHRVVISKRDAIIGVSKAENSAPTAHLASSASRLAWLSMLPKETPRASAPDAFVYVSNMPDLLRATRSWLGSKIYYRSLVGRMFVSEQEVILQLELDQPLAQPNGEER